ncbi:hypothetical protein [Nioella aestuarii]|uniref:hypothetical protein n=1 Tax=Nioella aestuarii TaxID=1662864 RepID=UPI003D7FFAA8
MLEEAAISKECVEGGGFHFAKEAVKKLILLKDKSVNLKDCWVYDHRRKEPSLQLGARETLSYMDLFSQIIHADPIQFWKSVDPQNPSLWIASKEHISSQKRQRFYGITWDQLADCFDDVANSMTAAPGPT